MAATVFPDVLFSLWLVYTLTVWVRRARAAAGYRRSHPPLPAPVSAPRPLGRVSVIVPARDEERNITRCLYHLTRQDYPDYEVIVVDDRSTDRTGRLVDNLSRISSTRVRRVRVEKLPPGWTGKNHAMQVGSKAASGDWLLFTDADTTHEPHSVRGAVEAAARSGIDFLTLAPEIECLSFWENALQPLLAGSLAVWFDPDRVNDPQGKTVLANGQYILMRRAVYESIGGSESVRNAVVEDVELARRVRGAGHRVQFLNGTRLYRTRMYTSLAEIHRGWTRIFTYLFDKKTWPIVEKILMFLGYSILPFVLLAGSAAAWAGGDPRAALPTALAALTCGVIVAVRWVGNRILRCNPWYALTHPLASAAVVWILATALVRSWFNRPSAWRGDLHR